MRPVVDAVPELDLIEIEGDAAFLSHTSNGGAPVSLTLQAARARHPCVHQARRYVAANLCPCGTCTQTDDPG